MAKRSKRPRGGPALGDDTDEGTPIVPRVIFTKDRFDPRLWARRPGEEAEVSGGVPSRGAMWLIYAVFIFVAALCMLTFILKSLGK